MCSSDLSFFRFLGRAYFCRSHSHDSHRRRPLLDCRRLNRNRRYPRHALRDQRGLIPTLEHPTKEPKKACVSFRGRRPRNLNLKPPIKSIRRPQDTILCHHPPLKVLAWWHRFSTCGEFIGGFNLCIFLFFLYGLAFSIEQALTPPLRAGLRQRRGRRNDTIGNFIACFKGILISKSFPRLQCSLLESYNPCL